MKKKAARGAAARVTRGEIEDFLYHEAALLDAWRLDEWLALLTADARYLVPSNDRPDADPANTLFTIADDIDRIRGRVTRLKDKSAHAEYPPSRTRRLIGNVRVVERNAKELRVESNFVIHRFRRNESIREYVGHYPQAAPTRKPPSEVSSKRPSRIARNQRAVGTSPPKQKKWTPAIGAPPRRAISLTTTSGPASTRRRVIAWGRALSVRTEFPIPHSAAKRSNRGRLAGPANPMRAGSPCPFILAAHDSTGSGSKQNCVTTCRSRPARRARLFFAASAASSAEAAIPG